MLRSRLLLAVWFAVLPVAAQQSASFKLESQVLNAGGHPADGVVAASANYRITLDAIGEAVSFSGLSSASFGTDAGTASCYRPPAEVQVLWFSSPYTMHWTPEVSVGSYNLYRDHLDQAAAGGLCHQPSIPTESTATPDTPSPGGGFFYLVTAENRIQEEGSRGNTGGGVERMGVSCP